MISFSNSDYFQRFEYLGIISENITLTNSFLAFYQNYSSIYHRKLGLKVPILTFNSIDEINNFHKPHKKQNNSIKIAFTIEQTEGSINFGIMKNPGDYDDPDVSNTWDDVNPFNLRPADKFDIMNAQHYFDFQKLFAKFLIYLNNQQIYNTNLKLMPQKTPKVINLNITETIFFTKILPFFFAFSYIAILFKFVLWLVTEKVI